MKSGGAKWMAWRRNGGGGGVSESRWLKYLARKLNGESNVSLMAEKRHRRMA